MKVVQLKNHRFHNGFGPKDADEAQAILEKHQEVHDAIAAGTAYVRYIDGDRKGSIARVSFDPAYSNQDRPCIGPRWVHWDREINQQLENTSFACVATWDGRKNKVKVMLSYDETEVLLDYDGPTIWEKFDAKAAKEEILKNPDQKDINGAVLAVGDRVLYINARYGSRMVLDEGKIVEFAVSANSRGHTVATIIESKTGVESSLQYPEDMVYRMP